MDKNRKHELGNQLNKPYDKKARGAQIHSTAKWSCDGEKNTVQKRGTKHKILSTKC